jgi:hypothetical protein
MKRVAGRVTWLCEFEPRLAELAAQGRKYTTLRRCHIVAAGDTLRLSTCGEPGVFAEVEVRRVSPISIHVVPSWCAPEFFCAFLGGDEMNEDAFNTLARADGFLNGRDLLQWLFDHGKFVGDQYDGQLIEW